MAYYGRFYRSAMYPVLRHFNRTLVAWAMMKFQRLKGRKMRASELLRTLAKTRPPQFVHWQRGMVGDFA
ncbi:group II intron maturase-specific domain-containing protein [Marinobacter lacisalsi]|uniref:Group II intron maturase-specific domain-containing protein n=1 Tax=Marinobacter lacisalsi TaxID=475979 RepID=A0ABV8QJW1_9GAMM